MKTLLSRYYIMVVGFSIGLALFNPILYIFLMSQGFSHAELGVYLGLFFLFSFLTEVPCGAITDVIGIKKTLLYSFSLRAIGLILLMSGHFPLLLLSAFISAVAESFQSGTLQSWLVNTLDDMGKKDSLAKIFSRSSIVASLLTMLVGFISSKVLYQYQTHLPLVISSGVFVVLFLLVLGLFSDPPQEKRVDLSHVMRESFHIFKQSVKELVLIREFKYLVILMLLPSILDVGPSNQWQEVFSIQRLSYLNGYI